jgi:hypothetical protein
MRVVHGAQAQINDPDTSRVWWSQVSVSQISRMGCIQTLSGGSLLAQKAKCS